ncbi:putative bifunctional diguanylate cyclase/phosphodiesterase [Paenibacillus chartarius]|uniref:Bifunctional diguanylate cyclase/phosphodiesterase n=1 Tax=Paenibacillus chartarius TaxID=747481 RepID=A0ABV6DGI1_9BACL
MNTVLWNSLVIPLLLCLIPFLMVLYVAAEVYFRNPRQLLNRTAAIQLICCSTIFLGEWLIATVPGEYMSSISLFVKFGGAFLAVSSSIYFFIRLSVLRFHNGWTLVLAAIPLAAYTALTLLPDVFILEYNYNGRYRDEELSPAFDILLKATLLYAVVLCSALLFFARRRFGQYFKLVKAERRKYTPLFVGMLATFLVLVAYSTLPEYIFDWHGKVPPRLIPQYGVLVWAFCIRYAIVKLNLLPSPERKYQILFRLSKHGIVLLDRHARVVEANPAFERMISLSDQHLEGAFIDQFLMEADQEPFRQKYYKRFRELEPLREELAFLGPDGQALITEAESDYLVLNDEILQYVILRNITERKRSELLMRHMAYHDDLTDLANRHLFHERMEQAIRELDRKDGERMAAVLLLDLDRFKLINDTLGHAAGDSLLMAIAEKLRSCCDVQATIARLGGDEFAILLPAIPTEETALQAAGRLMEALQAPIPLEGKEYYITVSIGISIAPADGRTPAELLRHADTAMYVSKQAGRNTYSRFSAEWNESNEHSLNVVNGLRHALERGEFLLYYQPQVNMSTGVIVGAEALIRWMHPVRGMVAPGEFIPLSEETGLIVPMGDWVLRTALSHWQRWRSLGMQDLVLSVNLSPKQVLAGGFVEKLAEVLAETGFPPDKLCLEVTEGIAIHDNGLALEVCRGVRELGVHLAIDDFGTGYSSLSALHRFPFTTMKLDRSFISSIGQQDQSETVLKAMLGLARGLHMDVVCEGVESREQWNRLQALGCGVVQGYLVSRPLPVAEFERFVLGSGTAAG